MTSRQIDLESCDTEPIHVIGSIQPIGALVAADVNTLLISHISENLAAYLPCDPSKILGQPLAELIGETACEELLQRTLDPKAPHLLRPWFPDFPSGSEHTRRIECLPHRYNGHIILEMLDLEENTSEVWQLDTLRQRIISDLMEPDTLETLANVSANIIREVTGFDRVMIYRFAEDKHGQVIAESTNQPDSFLDMHYPASDIPDPARRHFTLNLIRAIPDINSVPYSILTRSGEKADAVSQAPLDLTYSKLRAVAPVHIEYLSNMGVGASMSISLVSNGQLWGLVACHHYGPHRLTSSDLRFCEMLGGTISTLLQNLQNTALLRRSISAERTAYNMEEIARDDSNLHRLVGEHADALMQLFEAQGMVLTIDGKRSSFGTVPDEPIDFNALSDNLSDGIAVTDNLNALTKLTPDQISHCSGAACLQLSEDGADRIILLREQHEHVVKWAGKPDKVETVGSNGVKRLSPRGSFALWRQERRGRSKPFSYIDLEVLRILRRALFALNSLNRERAAVQAQKEAEAETSRMLMNLLEGARKSSMGELAGALAHELNQPLAAISNYVNACRQELYNCGITVPKYILRHIDDAVDEAARAANLVRRLRSFISTGELVKERTDLNIMICQAAELAVTSSDQKCLAELHTDFDNNVPPLSIDAIQIGQVVLNLVRNSIESIGARPGDIRLSTSLVGGVVEISVKDSGPGFQQEALQNLFEPFHSTTTEGMGMGLSLCRSIVEAHSGKIWNVPCKSGAEMRFSLPLGNEE